MKKIFLTILTTCLMLWACQRENIPGGNITEEESGKISFSTRGAVVATNNIEDMTMLCYQTGIADYDKTTSLPNHMYWAKVSRNKSGDVYYDWKVEPSSVSGDATVDEYWSQGNKHSFVAFAPFDISLYNYTPATAESAGLPTFTYTVADIVDDQKDLVYAITLNQLDNFADNDPAKRSVGLYFKHALSKIMFTAQLATGVDLPDGEKFRIAGIAINGVKESGKFSFKKAETTTETVAGTETSSADYINWDLTAMSDVSPVYSETELTYLQNDFITSASPETQKINIIAGERALFMIPQTFASPRTLRISYVHHTTEVPAGILKEYEITLPQNEWEAGKSITYNLKFNPSSGSSPWEAEAEIKDWEDTQTSVSASEAYFTLTDGKRHYGWSQAEGTTSAPRIFTIPFETNVPLSDITVSATGSVAISDINRTIIYTESSIEANDRDEITVTMKLRDGEGETAQEVTREMTIKIGGFEIIEQDADYGVAIEKRNYYYSRYSTKSQMYYADYDMPAEAINNDPTWTKNTLGYEIDFPFELYQVNEGQGNIATANPRLILPEGIEIIDGVNTAEKVYNTADNWDDSFGEKLLRLRITREMIGTATLKIGTAQEHRLSFSVLDGAIVTDYTDQEFVRDLTGLSTTYGGIDGLRVANSYITSPHTDYATIFYIPIKDRVNEFWREYSGVADPELYTIPDESWIYNDDFSVELSWYDGTNGGTSPEITDLQVEKNYSPSTNGVSAQNAILVVQPKNFEEQNYVINIKKNGTVIWSIHCWATKYNPYRNVGYTAAPERTDLNQAVGVVGGSLHSYDDPSGATTPIWRAGGIYVEKLIMDRNIGAKDATYSGQGAGNYGAGFLVYQLGRKDPFPGNTAKYLNGNSLVTSNRTAISLSAGVNAPTTINADNLYKWTNDAIANNLNVQWYDKNLADTDKIGKSIFDPSPLGYRVPIDGVWDIFFEMGTTWGSGGRTYGGFAFFTGSGYRSVFTGSLESAGVGVYRTTKPTIINSKYTNSGIRLDSASLVEGEYSHGGGFSVRSIQE